MTVSSRSRGERQERADNAAADTFLFMITAHALQEFLSILRAAFYNVNLDDEVCQSSMGQIHPPTGTDCHQQLSREGARSPSPRNLNTCAASANTFVANNNTKIKSSASYHLAPPSGLLNTTQQSQMADHDVGAESASSSAIDWILGNRLKAIGYTWLAGVGGSLVSGVDGYSLGCGVGSCTHCPQRHIWLR